MKALLLFTLLSMAVVSYGQSHVLQLKSKSGHRISLSFKHRYASIEVKDEASVQEAFVELKEFMKHLSDTHFLSRIYPLYVISPENKYFTYPLNRQRLYKRTTKV